MTAEPTSSTPQSAVNKPILAQIVFPNLLNECGERLRQGELVAFPTETVYGLGCHALDPKAIIKVFQAKERPLTDPLIVHVLEPEDACQLWNEEAHSVLQRLMKAFWPGPLTLVAPAQPHVPGILMAHTGYVACRSPKHGLARQLLKTAGVPIAAPSANKFGHVSPTKACHVFDDLKYEDVWILDDSGDECHVGIESTVAKYVQEQDKIVVLRQGAIAAHEMRECLDKAGSSIQVVSKSKTTTPDHVATVAPGQTLKHYSPHIPSRMVTTRLASSPGSADLLKDTVVVDWGGRLAHWKSYALAYRDLSPSGNSQEGAQSIFATLRWAEQVGGANLIVFPNLEDQMQKDQDALALAIQDRLTRAASGQSIDAL